MPDAVHHRNRSTGILDSIFLLGGIAILILFTTLYLMPFRLDDVLHMDWAREHSFWDTFHIQRGEIVRSIRPVFAMTIWILTHTAGVDHYFPWHFVLVGSFLIGLAYAGKTSRYIAKNDSALYFTAGFFWIAFLPILNVLFWYGDLTFTLELMFVAPAWYYGLRGLVEGRIGLLLTGILCGIFAVMAKEPALLLVHSVLIGTFILFFKQIKVNWKNASTIKIIFAAALYALFLAISLKIYFASPTKSNRFLNIGALSKEQFTFYFNDRLSYYSNSLLNPMARILLVTPLLYTNFRRFKKNISPLFSIVLFFLSLLIAFFLVKSLILFAAILIAAPLVNIIGREEKRSELILLPFVISAITILAVLLITTMVVKAQLTELSFVLLVIAGVYWSRFAKEISSLAKPYFENKKIKYSFISFIGVAIISCSVLTFSVIKGKETLLANVRDTRSNANDAIRWMGAHLPTKSTVLCTGTDLYGLGRADDMTTKPDEYKLYAQYTFLEGYIRSYFHALGRNDLSLGYLIDSLQLSRVLDSCRSSGSYYLFLQTGLDAERFHGMIDGKHLLKASDSLIARFAKGPYPSEIWELRK